jgi:hypothetical protein
MSINVDQLFGEMMTAGAQAFGTGWAEVEKFAKIELRTLAQRIREIGEGLAKNDFDLPTGKLLMAMQVNTATAAIAGATSLILLAVEAAINAVLATIKDAVNTSLGVALL